MAPVTSPVRSDTTLLNVALVPSDEVGSAVGTISKELAGRGGLFEVDGVTCFAHLTLYMARFPVAAADAVRTAVAAVARSLPAGSLIQTGYFVTPGNYYEVSYRKSTDVLRMQSAIGRALSALRFSPDSPVREDYFGEYSEAQRKNVREYGYDLVGELFRPHITVTRLDRAAELDSLPVSVDDLSFRADRIGIFEADNLGAARRRVATFELGPNAIR